jgi:hypothetical protein
MIFSKQALTSSGTSPAKTIHRYNINIAFL